MSELSSGRWQPWEPDGNSRHKCGSGNLTIPSFSLRVSNPETRPSPCPWCKDPVYYHTNGHGDSVYFDTLGVPWQVHPCWEQYWKTQSTGQKTIEQQRKALQQEERRHSDLTAAFDKAAKSTTSKYKNCSYSETLELKIAKTLHLSLKQLRQEYGHLYVFEPSGIRFLGLLSFFKQYPEKEAGTIEAPARLQGAAGKDTSKPEMVSCSRCHTKVRKDRLKHHLQNAHQVDIATTSISPEIRPLRSQAKCLYCSKIIGDRFLEKHVQLYHSKVDQAPSKRRKPWATCLYCLKSVGNYKKHVRKHHSNKLEVEP